MFMSVCLYYTLRSNAIKCEVDCCFALVQIGSFISVYLYYTLNQLRGLTVALL